MTGSAALTLFFEIVLMVGFALTSVRLFVSGLFRKYRVFFAYLIFSFLHLAGALAWDVRSGAYLKFFVITEPVLWIFYVLVINELYSLVLANYRGLYTLGRWAMYGALLISVFLSALTFLLRVSHASARQGSTVLRYYFLIERGVVCTLTLFILLILLLLTRYPVHLSRNVILHAMVYSAFFLSDTLGLFLRSVFGLSMSRSLSTVQIGVNAFCVLLWLLFLTEKGETRLVTLMTFKPDQEERILLTLNALNATVLKAARK